MLQPSPEITAILEARRTKFPNDDALSAAVRNRPANPNPGSRGTPATPSLTESTKPSPFDVELPQLSSLDIDLVNAFLEGLEHLSEAHFGRKVRLTEIAAWIQNPNVRTVLTFLKDLHTLRSEHIILNARNTAFARLAKLAHADPMNVAESERARKAATAILRYSTPTTGPARTPPRENEKPPPGSKPSRPAIHAADRDHPASAPPPAQRAANEVTGAARPTQEVPRQTSGREPCITTALGPSNTTDRRFSCADQSTPSTRPRIPGADRPSSSADQQISTTKPQASESGHQPRAALHPRGGSDRADPEDPAAPGEFADHQVAHDPGGSASAAGERGDFGLESLGANGLNATGARERK